MNSQDLRNLQEAYLDVYQEEVLDEVRGGGKIDAVSDIPSIAERGSRSPRDAGLEMSPLRRAEKKVVALRRRNDPEATRRANRIDSRFVRPTNSAISRSVLASINARSAEKKRLMNPQEPQESYEYDRFDTILEYLISEGYADTNESALAIMGNMSEDWRESIVEKFSMAADSSKPQSPKRTKLPKSREVKIGPHNDWNDKPTEWGELSPAAKKLRSRAITVTGTQRRQDGETGVT